MNIRIVLAVVLALTAGASAQSKSVLHERVRLELSKPVQDGALVHWKITNNRNVAVYVYNFYLWGPAYHVDMQQSRLIIETTPVVELASCPPNRFPPVLLLAIGPQRSIEGDFTDPNLKDVSGKAISMKVAVGDDPYSVVATAKRFMSSKCKHNPYDAIVRWGAILESNAVQLQSDAKELKGSPRQAATTSIATTH